MAWCRSIALGGLALFAACSSGDDPSPARLDPDEVSAASASAQDELLVESALLDDGPEEGAMVATGGPGPGGRRWRLARPLHKLVRAWGVPAPLEFTACGVWTVTVNGAPT